MNEIKNWFNNLKNEKPELSLVIDKIVNGISNRGFNFEDLNHWVDEELSKIEQDLESEFIKSNEDEN